MDSSLIPYASHANDDGFLYLRDGNRLSKPDSPSTRSSLFMEEDEKYVRIKVTIFAGHGNQASRFLYRSG